MQKAELLSLLSDGEFHSGSELGELLGVSRTAVWKTLSKFEKDGIRIESHKGKGYRIQGGVDLLDRAALTQMLGVDLLARLSLHMEDSLSSTNDYLMARESMASEFAVCLAEQQTHGKGRRGRVWCSPYAKNIYLSMQFELESGVSGLEGLSLAVGVACARALGQLGLDQVQLKWPNDIWIDGRKLAGILVELQGEANSQWRVVVGVGINVAMEKGDADIDQPWISMNELVPTPRNVLASALIKHLLESLTLFKAKGFAPFKEEWAKYDCLAGRKVYFQGKEGAGIAKGITDIGALRVEIEGKETIVNAGEVSVRPYAD